MPAKGFWPACLGAAALGLGLAWITMLAEADQPASTPSRRQQKKKSKPPRARDILEQFNARKKAEVTPTPRPRPRSASKPAVNRVPVPQVKSGPQTRPAIPVRMPARTVARPLGGSAVRSPAILPTVPGARRAPARARVSVSPNVKDRGLISEGKIIPQRSGRLVKQGDWWVFVFEQNGPELIEPPMKVLPGRWLEFMESESEGGNRSMIFVVTGEVTEYHGENYLLPRIVLVKQDLGNLRQ